VLKKLDWYIIKRFLGSFGFTIGLLVSISIAIDLSEKVDNFIEHHLTAHQVIFEFYVNFVPYIIALLGNYFIFITVIFFTSQLASNSEIIAMYNSGVSFARLLFPYIISATFLAGILWVSNNYIVPIANKRRLEFETKYISHMLYTSNRNIHRKINDSAYIYFEFYDNGEKYASKFSYEKIVGNQLKYKIVSERANYDTLHKQWTLVNYIERTFLGEKEQLNKGSAKQINLELDPVQFVKRWTYVEELTSTELREKIEELKMQGAENTSTFQLELYRRTASACGIIILSIIGMTIASKKMRGGLGFHLVLGIALCSIFEVIQKFSVTFATNADLSPFIAIWIPNMLFIILAGYLVYKFQK
jgi:lipopolysaccharide export system permease protein